MEPQVADRVEDPVRAFTARLDKQLAKSKIDPNAVILHNTPGYKVYTKGGLRHREGGPAYINNVGHKEYWQNGALHREDGPAVITLTGEQQWWRNGLLHRDDGPAVIRIAGTEEYWVNGIFQYRTRSNLRDTVPLLKSPEYTHDEVSDTYKCVPQVNRGV